jgi:hypothetical protein
MHKSDLVAAVEKYGLAKADAGKAVEAVLTAIRKSPTATLIFREVEGRSAPPEARRTIFLCG